MSFPVDLKELPKAPYAEDLINRYEALMKVGIDNLRLNPHAAALNAVQDRLSLGSTSGIPAAIRREIDKLVVPATPTNPDDPFSLPSTGTGPVYSDPALVTRLKGLYQDYTGISYDAHEARNFAATPTGLTPDAAAISSAVARFRDHTDFASGTRQPDPESGIPNSDQRRAISDAVNQLNVGHSQAVGCEPPPNKSTDGCSNHQCTSGSVTTSIADGDVAALRDSVGAVDTTKTGTSLATALETAKTPAKQATANLDTLKADEDACYNRSVEQLAAMAEAASMEGACAVVSTGRTYDKPKIDALAPAPPPPPGPALDCDKIDLSQMISTHFRLRDLLPTSTGIKNCPDHQGIIDNLSALAKNVLDPIAQAHGRSKVRINSGYRNTKVNEAVGGAKNSQHAQGQAADIEVTGMSNDALAVWIKSNVRSYDQLILEFHHAGQPDSGWVHVSYRAGGGRQMAFKIGGSGRTSFA